MRFTYPVQCSVCRDSFSFSTYGDAPWPSLVCPGCRSASNLHDPLSISVTAERLLYRSKAELDDGDYSLSILIATIAVESFLTRLFLKLKGMEDYAATFSLPTPDDEEAWEREYPRSGGFTVPADFVSRAITGLPFDEFVAANDVAIGIMSELRNSALQSPKQFFQVELFKRRNRIAHWGYVNSTKEEALLCHASATAIISILREMDKAKYAP